MKRWLFFAMLAGCASSPPPPAPVAAPAPCPTPPPPPEDHREVWERAKAHERKEEWSAMEAELGRAAELAPSFAQYHYKRGYALIKLAETSGERIEQDRFYEEAMAPLRRCIDLDPALAECRHFLAEALQATGNLQAALESYDAAIRADPTVPWFYPPCVELLIVVKHYDAAEGVANEGLRLVPVEERTRDHLYALHVLSFQVHQARGDKQAMIASMEKAREVDQDRHPEMLFNLGATYAVLEPPNEPAAYDALGKFVKRVCRGAAAKKYAEHCVTAQALMMKLKP